MGFEAESQMALEIEKKAISYAQFSGSTSIEKKLDLDPEEYSGIDYAELINIYEKIEKIKSASKLNIYSKLDNAPAATVEQAVEIESKLKQMTTESLAAASEISKAPSPTIAPVPSSIESSLEIENPQIPQKQSEIEIEKPAVPSSIEFEKEQPSLPKKEILPQSLEIEQLPPPLVPSMPKLLDETTEETQKKVETIRAQISTNMTQTNDPTEIKKKMLELTKELFKEKSIMRKEKIKSEIAVLKNMLSSGTSSRSQSRSGSLSSQNEAFKQMVTTIISSEETELSVLKDGIVDRYRSRINGAKDKFYSSVDQDTNKKQKFEEFVSQISSVIQSLPSEINQSKEAIKKKHSTELSKVLEQIGSSDQSASSTINTRLSSLNSIYDSEFNKIKSILAHEMDAVIDSASLDMFGSSSESSADSSRSIVSEINNTSEGALLSYLQSKDQQFYKRYESKKISKAESLLHAKSLMAAEKGVDKKVADKFFSEETEV